MNNPPSHMVIELEEKDVRQDLPKIVNGMSQIRAETIKDRKLTDQQRDEYLHMAYRLASGMQAVSDEAIVDKMQNIAERLTKNPLLLKYDPMQDGHWMSEESRFSENLEDLLISIVRDDFHDVDAKHHVLQAIKYLGVEDSPFKEKEKVYNTILPFQGPVQLEKTEGISKKIIGKLFGIQYKAKNLEDLSLHIDAVKEGFSPELIGIARERGYTELVVELADKEWKIIKPGLRGQEINSREIIRNQALINVANSVVKYTKPIAYLFLGALPKSLQDRLYNNLETFHESTAFTASCWTEIVSSIAGAFTLGFTQENGWYFLLAFPTLLDGIARGIMGLNSGGDYYEESVGSIFLKPFFYPLEKHLEKKPKNIMTIRMPVREIKASAQIPNPIEYYDEIARLEVPEEIEKSLVWGTANHHAYGKQFIKFVDENSGKKPKEISISEGIDREAQLVSYNHELGVDGFRKSSSLYCFNGGERYLATVIQREENSEKDVSGKIGKILESNQNINYKLEEIGKQTSAKYVHLREYKNKEVVNDVEASR